MRPFASGVPLRRVALFVFAFAAPNVSAVTHCVPSSFSGSCDDNHATIQAAITHSGAGDTVLVAPGTYAENLTLGVDITLQGAQGGVDARGRVSGAPNPATESIIAPAAGVGLTLNTGSAGATIDGFSFLGGTRAIESASGPINNLLIQNNHVAGFTSAGFFLNDSGTDITLSQNVIDGTSKTGAGDLIHLDTDNFAGFRLENNIIRNGNTATGFFVDGNNNVVASLARTPLFTGNLIIDNNTGMNLGSRSFDGGVIENNTFESNNFDGLQGGPQNSTIQTNIFRNNGRSGLALTSFGNAAADRGAQNLTITCNAFSGNLQEGLFFSSSQASGTIATNQAHNNNFGGNTAGATYNGTETINVESNWWGSSSGPTVASNPGGTGQPLAGTGAAFFDYTPFLTFTAVCVPGQAAPDLTINKIVSNATPNEGDSVTYTITITNNGGPATLVSVSDLLPAGVTYSSDLPSQGTYNSGTGVWDVGTVNSPGGTASLQIVATINAGTAGSTITNTATITASTPTDSTPGDNAHSVSLTVGQPNLSITKLVDHPTPQEGGSVTFTVTVTNAGANATSVTITDGLPAGLTFVSSNASQGSYASGTGVWSVGGLAAAGTATLQIVATVNAGTAGTTITNTATITTSTPADATPGNNTATVSLTVAQPDLSLTKSVNDATPQEGDTVTFTVVVANSPAANATAVSVTDLLPAGLTFVSSTPSQGSYASGGGVWTVGSVAASGSATLQIVATVNAGTAGNTITNTATITSSTPADPATGNNADSEALVVQQPDLSITKTADSTSVHSGANVVFTITVTNSGGGNATSVTVSDLVPGGLTYISSTPSQGSYDPAGGNWTVGAIPAGGNATLQIVARLIAPEGNTVTNTATITASTPRDATAGNNADSETITALSALPTVPALSPPGLLLLSLMLAAIALVALRR